MHPHVPLTGLFTKPHGHQERWLTSCIYRRCCQFAAHSFGKPAFGPGWITLYNCFLTLGYSEWFSPPQWISSCLLSTSYKLSIKVIEKHKMPWFDLKDFWEYPKEGQVRSGDSGLFPAIYYCLLLYVTNSSSTRLIWDNQSENDNFFFFLY